MAQKARSFRALADQTTAFGQLVAPPSSRLAINSLVLRCNITSGSKEK
jgi:hypothetical protein